MRDGVLSQVEGIAFSPDGALVYVTSSSETVDDRDIGFITIIERATRRVVGSVEIFLQAHDLALSPDGRFAYVAGGTVVTVVDTERLAVVAIVPVDAVIASIGVSPDGGLAYLTGSNYPDGFPRLLVMNTATNKVISRLPIRNDGLAGRIAVSPEGTVAVIAISGPTSRAALIDLTRFTVSADVAVGDGAFGVAIAPPPPAPPDTDTLTPTPGQPPTPAAGQACVLLTHGQFAASDRVSLSMIDPTANLLARSFDVGSSWTAPYNDWPAGIAISPDGRFAYVVVDSVGGAAGQLAVLDMATSRVTDRIAIGYRANGVVLSPDGATAYVPHAGGVVAINLVTKRLISIPIAGSPRAIAATPDGRFLYVSIAESRAVSVIDTSTRRVATTIDVGETQLGAGSLAMTPDGQSLYVTLAPGDNPDYYFNTVAVVDTNTNMVINTVAMPIGGNDAGVSVSPDGRFAYVLVSHRRWVCEPECFALPATVVVLDIAAQAVTATIPIGGFLADVVFDRGGNVAYVTNRAEGTVSVIDTVTHTVARTITVADLPSNLTVGLVSGGCTAAAGATPWPTRTPTATKTPRASTPWPTATPARTQFAVLQAGSAQVAPGGRATIAVTLHAEGGAVVGVQNDISFDERAAIAMNAHGKPACRVNPAIDKTGAFASYPVECVSRACTQMMRAIIFSFADLDPIADGSVLYTCEVEVTAGTSPGRYALALSNVMGSDAFGHRVPIDAADGAIVVPERLAGQAAAATPPAAGVTGCQLSASGYGRAGVLLLVPVALLWWRQRTRVHSGRRAGGETLSAPPRRSETRRRR
ncbi:MAG: hypothetical protein HY699_08120 [Deltaproteobacteria bacterium]|nr:hypothetical protein [Deltaproteobacteria bacterium]